MRRYVFEWRGDYFRLDPAALAFWPEARLVVPPDEQERLRLFTTHTQFIDFARSVGGEINEALSAADQCAIASDELRQRDYKSGTIPQMDPELGDYPLLLAGSPSPPRIKARAL